VRTERVRISVVVNTLNEETNIGRCLASVVGWADEIVVADMCSSDRTVSVAASFGAKILEVRRSTHVEAARSDAIAAATGGWVLLLDADEVVPPTLATELRRVAEADLADTVEIPFRNFLLGREIDCAGWERDFDSHLRFFKAGALAWGEAIHGKPVPSPAARQLRLASDPTLSMLHFSYLDVAHFVTKMNRYTDVEAAQTTDEPQRGAFWVGRRCAAEFYARFVRHKGWRAGWRGFVLSVLMAMYQFLVWAKKRERAEAATAGDNRACYDMLAAAVTEPGSLTSGRGAR
jgi:glycosyltransferase involved in cell wall biosynthesis